jgi:hypothetical protein
MYRCPTAPVAPRMATLRFIVMTIFFLSMFFFSVLS